jgi:hypothetical protein
LARRFSLHALEKTTFGQFFLININARGRRLRLDISPSRRGKIGEAR